MDLDIPLKYILSNMENVTKYFDHKNKNLIL